MRVASDRGVVHEDVDGSELAPRRIEKRLDVAFVADVAPPGPGSPAAPAHVGDELRGRRFLLAIRDRHGRAALGQQLGYAAAYAARAAGHYRYSAVELEIVEGHCLRGAGGNDIRLL